MYTSVEEIDQNIIQKLNQLHYNDFYIKNNLNGDPSGRYFVRVAEKYVNIGCTHKGCNYRYWFTIEHTSDNGIPDGIKYDRVIKQLHEYPLH